MKRFTNTLTFHFCLTVSLLFTLVSTVVAQSIRTQEVAQQIAQAFLLKEQATPPLLITKTDQRLSILNKQAGLTLGEIHLVKDGTDNVLAYIQALQPQGFIIVSALDQMRAILGFSFESNFAIDNKLNPLLDLVVADVFERTRNILGTTQDEGQLGVTTQWGPWLQTTWTQTGHWNNKCPYTIHNIPGFRRPVGCVATAMAQIVSYWKYPSAVAFSQDEYITISGTRYSLDNATGWGMPSLTELQNGLSSLSYNGNQGEEAFLSFGAGVKLHMDYGVSGSGSNTHSVRDVLNSHFGFGSAIAYSGSTVWPTHNSQVIEDMKSAWPVQIAIRSSTQTYGHSIVVDGYRDDGYFHLNYGWGPNSPDPIANAWYNIPTAMPGYDVVNTIVYNIAKYRGWNQYAADQQNTFRSIYPAPLSQPERKWRVNIPSGLPITYRYSHLVIGTGGRIYAALYPNILGDIYHPYVAIYDKYGARERLIEITLSNLEISYLAQNSNGQVFFGTSASGINAKVYRLNPSNDNTTTIFTHSNPDAGYLEQPIKIDRDDYLYFVITPQFTANYSKLYSITRTGSARWSYSFPSSAQFYRTIPAIDEDRNRVYLNYYNSSTQKSHLIAFQRSNGSVVFDVEIPTATHLASASAGPPAINSSGTVFLGALTSLFAYSSAGASLWEVSFSPAYTYRTPAIGSDGTLYVNYGKLVSGNWRPGYVRALNPANGTTKWELALSLTSNDLMGEIYSSANTIVCYTYRTSGQWRLGGVKDNGTSYGSTWDVEGGGTIAFGPGRIIVSIPPGSNNSIWALSDRGSRGDPEGLGMDYADNPRPSTPSNPNPPDKSSNRDTTNVQLSWSATHPLGHSLKYDVFVCALTDSQEAAFIPVATQLTTNSYTLTGLRRGTRYLWSVIATDGQSIAEGTPWSFSTVGLSTGVHDKDIATLPQQFALNQNYPNPFNPSTSIHFALPKASSVTIDIFDVLGQRIARIVDQTLPAGYHKTHWSANVASGIYFYRLRAIAVDQPMSHFVDVKKMILLR